jgi:UDP-2,4-diacetamido-2,4,6-trideoxy-beta-L-altropyranose hydrolase
MKPQVLFVVDGGPAVGGGHVMRSLTLARALDERRGYSVMLAPPAVEAVLNTFDPQVPREIALSTDPQALILAAQRCAFDAVVFDHYGLSRQDHEAIAQGRPSLVMDDLANRPLGGDLILDAGPARRPEDYAALAEPKVRLLLGPAYAPVRPAFAALRETSLARRGGPVQRILVAMGLTDVGGHSGQVVDRLRRRFTGLAIDVVLGSEAPSLKALQRVAAHDGRVVLHVDTPDVARLMVAADLGVGAAGSSTWERCTLGLPSVLLVLADNQRASAQAVAEFGAALVVDPTQDFDTAFDRAVVRLTKDAQLRASLSAASAATCDGLGAARAADAFLQFMGREA